MEQGKGFNHRQERKKLCCVIIISSAKVFPHLNREWNKQERLPSKVVKLFEIDKKKVKEKVKATKSNMINVNKITKPID